MKLQRREIITVGLGAAILVGALIYRFAGSRSDYATKAADNIPGAMASINEYAKLKHSVDTLGGQLNLELPVASAGDQETSIMEDIGRRAKDRGLQLSSLKPGQPTGRGRSAAVKPIQFRLEIAGRFESIVEFIYALEHAQTAYVVSELHLEGAGKGGRGRAMLAEMMGLPPPPDQTDPNQPPTPSNGGVRATMKIQSYLFPVQEQPKAAEEEKES